VSPTPIDLSKKSEEEKKKKEKEKKKKALEAAVAGVELEDPDAPPPPKSTEVGGDSVPLHTHLPSNPDRFFLTAAPLCSRFFSMFGSCCALRVVRWCFPSAGRKALPLTL
jgi:hypothetical protein